MRLFRLLTATLTGGLAAAALAIAPATASANPPVTQSGVYAGAANVAGVESFAAWRGASVPVVGDFTGDTDWSDVSNSSWLLTGLQPLTQQGTQLVLCVPMLVQDDPGTFEAGATGAYDQYFASLAQELAADGDGSAIIRLGAEFNGSWEPYAVEPSGPDSSQYFIAYWQHIVDLFRSVPGTNFKFDFNPNIGEGTSAPDAAYPGNAYVDYIGLDLYDNAWSGDGGDTARWQTMETMQYGLNWWNNFAQAHGKPFSIPEWGLVAASAGGGGDDPYYIQQMYAWMAQNQPAFEIYFDYGVNALSSSSAPQATAAYQQLYQDQAVSTTSGSSSASVTSSASSTASTPSSDSTSSTASTSASGSTSTGLAWTAGSTPTTALTSTTPTAPTTTTTPSTTTTTPSTSTTTPSTSTTTSTTPSTTTTAPTATAPSKATTVKTSTRPKSTAEKTAGARRSANARRESRATVDARHASKKAAAHTSRTGRTAKRRSSGRKPSTRAKRR